MKSHSVLESDEITKGIVRKVRLSDIIMVEGTNPRLKLREDRVEFFCDLLSDADNAVEPIVLIAVQTGDSKSSYVIIEGLHRHEAYKRRGVREIRAMVLLKPTFHISELEEAAVRTRILALAAPYNSKTKTPLSSEEIITASIKMRDADYTNEQIAKYFSISMATLMRLLSKTPFSHEQKLRRLKQREQSVKMIAEGKSNSEIARATGLDRKTIIKIRKNPDCALLGDNETEGCGSVSRETLPHPSPKEDGSKKKRSAPGITYLDPDEAETMRDSAKGGHETETEGESEGNAEGSGQSPEKLLEEEKEIVLGHLSNIAEMLRVSKWFSEADEYVIQYILPVLAHKSDTLHKILEETNGMKNLFLSAKTDYSDLVKNYNKASKKIDEQAALIKELSEELTTRAKLCGLKCRFIKEAEGRETERTLDYLVTVLGDYVNAINDHYVPSWEKGKGRIRVPVPVAAEDAFRQQALNFSYIVISHLEYARTHQLTVSEKMYESHRKFLNIAAALDLLKKKDVRDRYGEVKAYFARKSGSE